MAFLIGCRPGCPSVRRRRCTPLPGFDEFLLGYQDRGAALAPEHAQRIVPGGNGMFLSTIVVKGQVVGTWRRRKTAAGITVTPLPFATLPPKARAGFVTAAQAYGTFVGATVTVDADAPLL